METVRSAALSIEDKREMHQPRQFHTRKILVNACPTIFTLPALSVLTFLH